MRKPRVRSRPDAKATWLAENPLKKWREQQEPEGWNRSLLARQLRVTPTAVILWESGERLPRIDHFVSIETLTKITGQEWMAWFRSKPKHEKRSA